MSGRICQRCGNESRLGSVGYAVLFGSSAVSDKPVFKLRLCDGCLLDTYRFLQSENQSGKIGRNEHE